MMMHGFLAWLVGLFALRRRRDVVIKPVLTLALYLAVYAVLRTLVFRMDPSNLLDMLPLVAVAQLPFLLLAFMIVHYLDGLQAKLSDLAMTDVLTGLPNRRAFVTWANNLQRHGNVGFLLIIDADHFKRINDTHGHAVGDVCLQAIAARLQQVKRPHDLVGRIGGEEFGLYLPYATMEELSGLSHALCRPIPVAVAELNQPLSLTLSVGAAETHPKEPVDSALQRADEALYVAKAQGRARMILWHKHTMSRVA